MTLESPVLDHLTELPITRRAFAYAQRLHAKQRRKVDRAPFILHPLEVASLLFDAGAPDRVIAAGILHDVLEKTDADQTDLRSRFGPEVLALVLAVSEDGSINRYAARKAALRAQVGEADEEAQLVFAADKISKARELNLGSAKIRELRERADRATPSLRAQLNHLRGCLILLEEVLPGSPLVVQLRSELDRLPGSSVVTTTKRQLATARRVA